MLLTVQNVKAYKALPTDNSRVYGDGTGSENPIDCRGATKLVLLLTLTRGTQTGDVRFGIEWSSGSDGQYTDAHYTLSSGTATTKKLEYRAQLIDARGVTAGTTVGWALSADVEGRWARVWAKDVAATVQSSLAILALTAAA